LSLAKLMMRWLLPFPIISLVSLPSVDAQPATPAQSVPLPQAIYSPQPVYRSEWAKQGLTGKGVVLVTIDPKTGMVTGTRMLQSTGSKLLDGAALEAYSKWRFKPGSVPQVKMPIEFASRPRPQPSKQVQKQPSILYVLLIILLGLGAVVSVMRKRKTSK
jgi:TonB family protein